MKNNLNIIGGLLITSLLLPCVINAQLYQQPDSNQQTIRLAANTGYNKASGFKRMMLGEHYRKEWGTAVDIPVLDMEQMAGGLTPIKMGGGLQTKSLRLKGKDGKEYVLRSVDKDPSKAIVAELRGTFAEDIVQDQISSSHPYAPMVVASLANAAGILHSTPQLVYVPRTEKLGEFAADFADRLCLLEERPSGNEENNAAFGYSKQVINSEKLSEKIFSNNYHRVDARAFLKARLFDMLIGDWDRHQDQWQWAAFENGENTYYLPIPRDRDQAFSKMDGLIPQLATRKWGIRKIQHFDDHIRDINGLNMNGAHIDRAFLTELSLNQWIAVAEELQREMSNGVIEMACRQMPEAIYQLSGKSIEENLKIRRDDLPGYAKDYYHFLNLEVNITGTKNKEIFSVTRENDDSTTVIVYRDGNGDLRDRVIYHRVFLRSQTNEIRLYGLGGDDVFNIKGDTRKGIVIRIVGGKGDDGIYDRSTVNRAGRQTKVYDDANNTYKTGKEARLYISSDSLKNEYNPRGFRYDWLAPLIMPGYNVDDGLLIGASVVYKKQQFGKAPYGYMQAVSGSYAFSTGAWSLGYKGIFREFIGKSDLLISAKYNSSLYTRNYYGLGNETINDEEADKDFYRLRQSELSFSSALQRKLGTKHTITIGGEFQSLKIEETEGRFVSKDYSSLDSSDFTRKYYGNIQLGYQFSTVDNPLYPRKGLKLETKAIYVQNLQERETSYVQVLSKVSFYNSIGRFTLASRTGITTNIGNDYEFYQANGLGGLTNLRGYRRDRFTGKTSVYQNSELRVRLGDFNAYIMKGPWGLLAFGDHGRVWIPNEESDKWHHGYGGGVWFMPFNKMVMTATYGTSEEEKLFSVSAGFLF